MDRKSIIGFVLIAVILVVWMTINSKNTERENALRKQKEDSIALVNQKHRDQEIAAAKRKADSIARLPKDTSAVVLNQDSIVAVKKQQVYGVFSNAMKGDNTPV